MSSHKECDPESGRLLCDGRSVALAMASQGHRQEEGTEDNITARLQESLAPYPEPHQLCDGRLILSQGTHVGILLEGGHIVIDVQNIDPDPACGLLSAPIPGNDCQSEALDELIVQFGDQHDKSRVLVQREPGSGRKEDERTPWCKAADREGLHLPACPCPRR